MAKKKQYEYVQEGEFTERQWFLKGFLLNKDAKGAERYTNSMHQKTAIYYSADEVHEGGDELKQIKKQKAHEAYARRKEEERLMKEREEYREHMHTENQWLYDVGRIPVADARWELGEDMNRWHHTCSYGSNYYYCHESNTRVPKDADDLAIARWRLSHRYKEWCDAKLQKEKTYSDEKVLDILRSLSEEEKEKYYADPRNEEPDL